ncbi:spore coat protein GerQ [Mechercharimyces sp. CAU 1602]|uniref:spore coat protein GerQ n=1 Tax=Mechercharimyces sp. CAU 1602 TaxID=2973933 RepID=UPI00216259DF|nr:spore coat protein GerQ [Mechercharimyces sp. CAU 1602]MCS1350036.1 spore coat protein GerQ [Mechercharimyces sp. CAU 1602]
MYWNPYASTYGRPPGSVYPEQTAMFQAKTSQRGGTQLYTEDVMRANIGKLITVYLTFENNPQWPSKVFTGTLREAGRDFILIRDQQSGKDVLLMNIDIDYYVFDNQPANLAGNRQHQG